MRKKRKGQTPGSPAYIRNLEKSRLRLARWTAGSKKGDKGPLPVDPDEVLGEAARAAYGERTVVLRIMGYHSYGHYLDSDLWAGIRAAVLSRDEHRCWSCKGPGTEVHHGDYQPKTMKGERLERLYSLCSRCHERIEFFRDGRKRTPKEATDFLVRSRRTPSTGKQTGWKKKKKLQRAAKLEKRRLKREAKKRDSADSGVPF